MLGLKFTIHNVLYISKLKYNLIFIGQLMEGADYLISLSIVVYVIQDPISRRPIGVVERKDRLFFYRLLDPSSSFAGSTMSSDSRNYGICIWNIHPILW